MSIVGRPPRRSAGPPLALAMLLLASCGAATRVDEASEAPSAGVEAGEATSAGRPATASSALESPADASGDAAIAAPPARTAPAPTPSPGAMDGLVIGASRPAEAGDDTVVLDATTLVSMSPGIERWRIVAGDHAGGELLRRRTASDLLGAHIADTWMRGDGSDEVIETYLLRAGPDGSIVMPGTLTHRDRAISEFEPPLLLAPPELRPAPREPRTGKPGEPAGASVARARMTVIEEDPPRRVKEKGLATRDLRIVDRVAISTPLGDFDAIRVSSDFRARLSMASARELATMYVVPGLGMVAEQRREEIRAIGLFSRTTERTIVRLTR